MVRKITEGYVIQEFDETGMCLGQVFVAGDHVTWEDEDGNPVDPVEEDYFPFEMEQPE